MTDKNSIITSAASDPTRIDLGKRAEPPRTHSGEWIVAPAADDVIVDDSLPMSMRESIESIYAEQRAYFAENPDDVEAIKRSDEYLTYVVLLSERARVAAALEGHWARGNASRYVELLSAAYVWAKLSE